MMALVIGLVLVVSIVLMFTWAEKHRCHAITCSSHRRCSFLKGHEGPHHIGGYYWVDEQDGYRRNADWWRGVHDFAEAVGATSDEFGEDVEGSVERLCGLLSAVDEPDRWKEFRAPDKDDIEDS